MPDSHESERAPAPAREASLFLLTLGAILLCAWIAYPFLPAITGAVTLAIVTFRPYRWLESKCKRAGVASAIAVVLVTFSLVAPAFFVLEELAQQALGFVDLLRKGAIQQKMSELLAAYPAVAARLEQVAGHVNLKQAGQNAAGWAGGHLAALVSNSVSSLTQLGVMLFLLFFLYRDNKLARSTLRSLLPLREQEVNLLLARCGDTIFATALGRFAVAAAQGVAAGLGYWVLGVSGALFWAMMTAVAALIPAVGSFLIWAPVAVYLGLTGHWGKAALLAGWGAIVVSNIDNVLYPVLVGSRLQQHTATILISVLGGIALFGVSGLILGPLLLTAAEVLLRIWRERQTVLSPEAAPNPSSSV